MSRSGVVVPRPVRTRAVTTLVVTRALLASDELDALLEGADDGTGAEATMAALRRQLRAAVGAGALHVTPEVVALSRPGRWRRLRVAEVGDVVSRSGAGRVPAPSEVVLAACALHRAPLARVRAPAPAGAARA